MVQFHVICLELSVLEKYVFTVEDCLRRMVHRMRKHDITTVWHMGQEDPIHVLQKAMTDDFKTQVCK